MQLLYKSVKGYFLWSIPFLCFACTSNPAVTGSKPDPANCEWYADIENQNHSGSGKLGVYALRFYPDSNYTLCADLLFEQGRWYFDNERKLIVLKNNKQPGTKYITDQKLPNNQVQFSFYSKARQENGEAEEIIKVKALTNQSAADPYSSAMHHWRTRPLQHESKLQIQQRVISYMNFLKALYTHAKENKLENAGGTWYARPIQFYSNTVRMAYNNELVDWYACFFSEEQAVEAYSMIAGALQKVKISGDEDNSRNINCIDQLLAILNKL
jgi:hypothetical protein